MTTACGSDVDGSAHPALSWTDLHPMKGKSGPTVSIVVPPNWKTGPSTSTGVSLGTLIVDQFDWTGPALGSGEPLVTTVQLIELLEDSKEVKSVQEALDMGTKAETKWAEGRAFQFDVRTGSLDGQPASQTHLGSIDPVTGKVQHSVGTVTGLQHHGNVYLVGINTVYAGDTSPEVVASIDSFHEHLKVDGKSLQLEKLTTPAGKRVEAKDPATGIGAGWTQPSGWDKKVVPNADLALAKNSEDKDGVVPNAIMMVTKPRSGDVFQVLAKERDRGGATLAQKGTSKAITLRGHPGFFLSGKTSASPATRNLAMNMTYTCFAQGTPEGISVVCGSTQYKDGTNPDTIKELDAIQKSFYPVS